MAEQFGGFHASELFCPKCRQSQPVRERLLLVLPTGEIHEYVCARCFTSLGKRTVSGQPSPVPPSVRRKPGRPNVRGLLGRGT